MKKRVRLFLCALLLLVSILTSCTGVSGQSDLVQDNSQIQNAVVENFTETEVQEEFSGQAENEALAEDKIQTDSEELSEDKENIASEDNFLDENGSYTSKEDVAAYLHQYGKLPTNFITKKEAKSLAG